MTADQQGRDLAKQVAEEGNGLAVRVAAEEKAQREAFEKALANYGLSGDDDGGGDEEPDNALRAPPKKNTSKAKPPQDADEDDEVDEDSDDESDVEIVTDEDGDEEGDEESDETEDDADGDDDGSSTEYERALRLLKLKHFTADDLKSLSRKRVIEIAERIRQDEATITKKLEARAKTAAGSDKAAERDDAGDRKDPAAPKGLRAHATRLSKVFDDEAAGAIIETLEGAAGEFEQSIVGQLTEMRDQVAELSKLNTQLRLDNFRARLQRLHPDHAEALDDERIWGRMVKRMNALKDTGEYKSADDLAADVISQVLKDRNKHQQSLRDRERGTQRAPLNRAVPPKAMSMEEAQRAVFEAALDGDKKKLARLERVRTTN